MFRIKQIPTQVYKTRSISTQARDELCKTIGVSNDTILVNIEEIKAKRKQYIHNSVGFVPTMGALHEGHLSLLKASTKENDITTSSIFVNPAQFAPHEDFGKYPRTLQDDVVGLFENGVDYIFTPSHNVMYPGSEYGKTSTDVQSTFVVPFGIDERADQEGHARPGFFRGVATVVCKLFNIMTPTNAYFGQKDGLQCIVVRQMVHDLNIDTKINVCPTIRESDGLAMSSRNRYLSDDQRKAAPTLYKALLAAQQAYDQGERDYDTLRAVTLNVLNTEPQFATEYVSICDAYTAKELNEAPFNGNLSNNLMMVSSAVSFGNCRILDNVMIGSDE